MRLPDTFADEIRRIFGGFFARPSRNIRLFELLRNGFSGDAVIFQSEMAASSVCVQMRFQEFQRRVPADVTVKFAVNGVARITGFGAPNLLRSFHVAGENRHAVAAQNGRVNAETRARVAIKNRVRIADEIFDSGVFE
jgi:hypothetical protein